MPNAFPNLDGHGYLNLTTYRKSGAPVVTPVWFAADNGRLVLTTQASAGKIKRIRNNPQVLVAPCGQRGQPLGEAAPGQARELSAEEGAIADQILLKKYGFMKRVISGLAAVRGSKSTYFEIVPAS
jgi:PPOX class probable F420-dependent enzyme